MEKLGEPKAASSGHVQGGNLREQTQFVSRERPSIRRPYLARGVERASSSQGYFEPTFPVSGVGKAISVFKNKK